jgi:hypothetical protein
VTSASHTFSGGASTVIEHRAMRLTVLADISAP